MLQERLVGLATVFTESETSSIDVKVIVSQFAKTEQEGKVFRAMLDFFVCMSFAADPSLLV